LKELLLPVFHVLLLAACLQITPYLPMIALPFYSRHATKQEVMSQSASSHIFPVD